LAVVERACVAASFLENQTGPGKQFFYDVGPVTDQETSMYQNGSKNDLARVIEARFGVKVPAPDGDLASETLFGLLNHRSHRDFLSDPVPQSLLDFLFACALSAPSKSDLQQVGIINIVDPDQKDAIADLVPQFPWVRAAPAFVVFCGDNRRIRKVCDMRGHAFANDHLDSFLNASVDAGIAMTNMIHAAAAVGLGCCPVSMIRNRIDELQDLLALPEWVFPVSGLAIGYPTGEGEISPRLPPDVTVHTDRYSDRNLAEKIDEYDRRRHAQQPFDAEHQRHEEEYGRMDFYGWSEDKARQYSKSQRADFGAYIRRQGFGLD
jgi:nitroreductase/FMN reductase [NAD(P)H]